MFSCGALGEQRDDHQYETDRECTCPAPSQDPKHERRRPRCRLIGSSACSRLPLQEARQGQIRDADCGKRGPQDQQPVSIHGRTLLIPFSLRLVWERRHRNRGRCPSRDALPSPDLETIVRSAGLGRRLAQLYLGLFLFGFSVALMVLADLGVAPWDVFHQGVARRTDLTVGAAVVATSVAVLVLWIPLRQRPGVGTISNAVLVGVSVDLSLLFLPSAGPLALRLAYLVGGIVLNGIATGLYIGAALGPGPRDGLMTGIAARGHSIRTTRTAIEVSVLAAGWLLGGTVGIGTVAYALAIGPLAHVFIPRLTVVTNAAADDERTAR